MRNTHYTYGTRREAFEANEIESDEAEQRRYSRMAAQRRTMERVEKRMVVEATLRSAFPQRLTWEG